MSNRGYDNLVSKDDIGLRKTLMLCVNCKQINIEINTSNMVIFTYGGLRDIQLTVKEKM